MATNIERYRSLVREAMERARVWDDDEFDAYTHGLLLSRARDSQWLLRQLRDPNRPIEQRRRVAWPFTSAERKALGLEEGLEARAFLVLRLEGVDDSPNLEITLLESVVVGRASSCEITIDSPRLGAQQSRFASSVEGYTVEDLQSPAGTRVNGVLTRGVARLAIEDDLTLGGLAFRVVPL